MNLKIFAANDNKITSDKIALEFFYLPELA
jgi:hypothetical protein